MTSGLKLLRRFAISSEAMLRNWNYDQSQKCMAQGQALFKNFLRIQDPLQKKKAIFISLRMNR